MRAESRPAPKVIYETRALDTVNDSIAEVLNGQIKARIVFEM